MRSAVPIAAGVLALWPLATPVLPAEPTAPYSVQKGDTLYDIADAYLLRRQDYHVVQRLNHIANPRRMRAGAVLNVPTRLMRTALVEARLGAFRGPVQITADGRPAPLAIGTTMREGVVIATGANAFARLDMPDGSRLAIPSQSRVRVDTLRRVLMTSAVERAFTVESGRGESVVTRAKTPQDAYIVRTPLSVSAVRGTEFHVHYEPEQQVATTEVWAGTVQVSSLDSSASPVPAGFGLGANAAGPRQQAPLLPPPKLLQADKTFDGSSVDIEVSPSDQARSYRVRLAADAGFIDMLDETTTSDPHTSFRGLGDGDYFVRLSAIDGDGLEGMPGTYAINRVLNTLSLLPLEIVGDDRMHRYLFRWEVAGRGERSYRFQLYKGDAPRPVIDRTGLTAPQITVTDLQPGVYSWRVMSRTISADRRMDKWTTPESFRIGQ
jgi:hypothetical protein